MHITLTCKAGLWSAGAFSIFICHWRKKQREGKSSKHWNMQLWVWSSYDTFVQCAYFSVYAHRNVAFRGRWSKDHIQTATGGCEQNNSLWSALRGMKRVIRNEVHRYKDYSWACTMASLNEQCVYPWTGNGGQFLPGSTAVGKGKTLNITKATQTWEQLCSVLVVTIYRNGQNRSLWKFICPLSIVRNHQRAEQRGCVGGLGCVWTGDRWYPCHPCSWPWAGSPATL